MKKLAIIFGIGAAALLGGSAANAADNTVKAQAATGVSQSTDFSSRHRGHHYSGGYGRSYAYAPRANYGRRAYAQPYYGDGYGYGGPAYGGGYGYGGPSISFGFGGGRGW
jgi:hypothetical protein